MGDVVRLGLAFHVWPFATPAAELPTLERTLLLARVTAVLPAAPTASLDMDDDG